MQDPSIAFDCFVLCIKNSFHSNFNIKFCIYYIILSKASQELSTISHLNHAEGVYIINSTGIAYHQHEALYIIKPQEDSR